MVGNSSICDDQVFAQLTDMFGDSVPTEIILRTGSENKWIRKYYSIVFFLFFFSQQCRVKLADFELFEIFQYQLSLLAQSTCVYSSVNRIYIYHIVPK